jgi:hypothetical protein
MSVSEINAKSELQSKCGGRAVDTRYTMGIIGGIVEIEWSNWAIEVVDAVTDAAAAVGLNVGLAAHWVGALGWRVGLTVQVGRWAGVVGVVLERL